MKEKFTDFYEAWWYLNEHEMFADPQFKGTKLEDINNLFALTLEIDVQKVNPKTCEIDDDESKNTKVEVWLECGEPYTDENGNTCTNMHDLRYDCGGDTFEEAIINLANLVKEHNDKTIIHNLEIDDNKE